MSDEKAPPRTVKVVDRRKFTADGEPREGVRTGGGTPEPQASPAREPSSKEPVTRDAQPPAEAPPAPAAPPPEASRGPDATQSKPNQTSTELLELIGMLAQNAEMLLVGTDDVPARPAEARRVIDWLAALETKTVGNLSPEEQKFLTDIVFQLRSFYLQRTK